MDSRETTPFAVLLFDVGGIFVDHDNGLLFRRLQAGCRPGTTTEAVAALFAEERFGTGAASIADLHAEFRRRLGYAHDWAAFVADWCCHFTLVPPMLALAETLAVRHRVALFSNTNAEHWGFVVALSGGRLDRFERYLSHEIGLAKPSPAAFRHVAAALGADPGAIVFFDDVAANVEGARRAGFQAELFTGEAAFRGWLGARGFAAGPSQADPLEDNRL